MQKMNFYTPGNAPLIEEPEEIYEGVFATDLSFNEDKDGGKIHLSFDATEEEPDGDSFETTFDIKDNKVKMYYGVQYSNPLMKALSKFILSKL